jgi:hypothetical protein
VEECNVGSKFGALPEHPEPRDGHTPSSGLSPVIAPESDWETSTMDERMQLRRTCFKAGLTTNETAQEKRRREALAVQRAVSISCLSYNICVQWPAISFRRGLRASLNNFGEKLLPGTVQNILMDLPITFFFSLYVETVL